MSAIDWDGLRPIVDREVLRTSVQDVADRIGRDDATVYRWIRGETKPGGQSLAAVRIAFSQHSQDAESRDN